MNAQNLFQFMSIPTLQSVQKDLMFHQLEDPSNQELIQTIDQLNEVLKEKTEDWDHLGAGHSIGRSAPINR